MANTTAAKKAWRQAGKRRDKNRVQITEMRKGIKSFKKFVDTGAKDKATAEMPKIVSMIDKAVKNKLIHKNNAAHKKSQLARLVADKKATAATK